MLNRHGDSLTVAHLQAEISRQPGLMSWDTQHHMMCQAFPEYAVSLAEWAKTARPAFVALYQAR